MIRLPGWVVVRLDGPKGIAARSPIRPVNKQKTSRVQSPRTSQTKGKVSEDAIRHGALRLGWILKEEGCASTVSVIWLVCSLPSWQHQSEYTAKHTHARARDTQCSAFTKGGSHTHFQSIVSGTSERQCGGASGKLLRLTIQDIPDIVCRFGPTIFGRHFTIRLCWPQSISYTSTSSTVAHTTSLNESRARRH